MFLFHATATSAANFAAVGFSILAGHMLGDHPIQRDADAACKGRPTAEQLALGANAWAGWAAVLRHVGTYLACQAITLLLLAIVAPITFTGAVAALLISGSTHAVIDRRWLVRSIIRIKGGCPNWAEAPYWIDQSLHYFAMFLAAIAAAAITSVHGVVIVAVAAAALLVACLLAEAWSAPVPATTTTPAEPAATSGATK